MCCPEIGTNPKTLGVLPDTTIEQLAEQCAARFDQGECLEDNFVFLFFCFIYHSLVPHFINNFYFVTLIFKGFYEDTSGIKLGDMQETDLK